MAVINTNITALIGQQNLTKSASALQTAMERLSSGLRINSAADDAAGQAIANRMSAQINGLSQAQRNANDGISVAQTAGGALNQVNDNLQRIRQLTVQAANGTNSTSDLASIQDEINQRLEEIDRVSKQTSFNGVNVLASNQELQIQVGANDGQTIGIQLNAINRSTLGLQGFNVVGPTVDAGKLTPAGDFQSAVAAKSVAISFDKAGKAVAASAVYIQKSNGAVLVKASDSKFYAASFNKATGLLSFNTGSGAKSLAASAVAQVAGPSQYIVGGQTVAGSQLLGAEHKDANGGAASGYSVYRASDGTLFAMKTAGSTFTLKVEASTDGTSGNVLNLATGKVTIRDGKDSAALNAASAGVKAGEVLHQPGVAAKSYDMTAANAAHAGTNTLKKNSAGAFFIENVNAGVTTYYAATADAAGKVTAGAVQDTSGKTANPLDALDKALAQVDGLRSGLGAIQNRFTSAIDNLANTTTNLSAAQSRIQDADYAVEVSNMTRAQILQQAGTAVLAQANQVPQTVLSLLR